LKTNLYFAGRVILQNGQAAFVDRLGSDRKNTRYYPYGEEYTATTNDKDKFAPTSAIPLPVSITQ